MRSKNSRSDAKTKRRRSARTAPSQNEIALAEALETPLERFERLQAQAHQTFLTRLPELLEKHSGQWVAYRGKKLLDMAPGKTELLQKCLRRGLDPKELMVRKIRPGAGEPPTLFETGMV